MSAGNAMSGREYPARPLVGIGIIVLRPDSLLLVRRGRPPAEGRWSLPGGGQELGETAEAGARRELMEETGLEVGPMRLVGHADSIHLGPDGRVRFHYTILDFAAIWRGGEPVADGDVLDAMFVPFHELAAYDLWSEIHRVVELARRADLGGDQLEGASG